MAALRRRRVILLVVVEVRMGSSALERRQAQKMQTVCADEARRKRWRRIVID